MRALSFIYCFLILSGAHAASEPFPDEPHAYLRKDYNGTNFTPAEAVSKFLETAFPDAYGRELLSFYRHFAFLAGTEKASFLFLPDLPNGLSTRASTMQYIQRHINPGDAVLFVNDPINESIGKVSPQSFSCRKVFYREIEGIDQEEFKKEFFNNYMNIHQKIKNIETSTCFRLALKTSSPVKIAEMLQEVIRRSKIAAEKYFIVMDQRHMPGQINAQYSKQDWDAAFSDRGYLMLIDLYADTSRH